MSLKKSVLWWFFYIIRLMGCRFHHISEQIDVSILFQSRHPRSNPDTFSFHYIFNEVYIPDPSIATTYQFKLRLKWFRSTDPSSSAISKEFLDLLIKGLMRAKISHKPIVGPMAQKFVVIKLFSRFYKDPFHLTFSSI